MSMPRASITSGLAWLLSEKSISDAAYIHAKKSSSGNKELEFCKYSEYSSTCTFDPSDPYPSKICGSLSKID